MTMKIGVLAIQGDFAEHISMLHKLGVEASEVRLPAHLDGLDGLIMPGGESTTIGKLAVDFGLLEPLRQFGQTKAIWGTCAGAILLSKDALRPQPLLGLMDITVQRNAFGRQVDFSKPTWSSRRCKRPPAPPFHIMPFSSAPPSSSRSMEMPAFSLPCPTVALWRRSRANCWQPPFTPN